MRTRLFGVIAAVTVTAGALAACGSGGSGSPSPSTEVSSIAASPRAGTMAERYPKNPSPATIVFAGNGGNSQQFMIDVLQKPFSELTGNTFSQISPPDITQIQAQAAANKTVWDVAVSNWSQTEANCPALFDPVNTNLYDLPNLPPLGKCAVPAFRYANLLLFNPKDFPNKKPSTLKDFFDTKTFPGTREISDSPKNGILEMALIADGVAPDKLYPLDVTRALRKLDTIKSDLVIAASTSAHQNDVQSNQAVMTIMVSTTANVLTVPMTPIWDFTTSAQLSFAVLHNAPHAAEAQKFMAFITEPSTQAAYAAKSGLGVVNKEVNADTIAYTDTQRTLNAFQSGRGTVRELDNTFWDANFAQIQTTWTKWKVS